MKKTGNYGLDYLERMNEMLRRRKSVQGNHIARTDRLDGLADCSAVQVDRLDLEPIKKKNGNVGGWQMN